MEHVSWVVMTLYKLTGLHHSLTVRFKTTLQKANALSIVEKWYTLAP
jgi:hypothetical protein